MLSCPPYGTAQHDLGGQLDRSLGGDSSTGAREGTAQQEPVRSMCMALGRSMGGDSLTGACEEEYEYGTGQGPRRAKGS